MSLATLSVAFLWKFILQVSNEKCDRLEETIVSKNYPNYILWGLNISSCLQGIKLWGDWPVKSSMNHMRGLSKVMVGGENISILLRLSLKPEVLSVRM